MPKQTRRELLAGLSGLAALTVLSACQAPTPAQPGGQSSWCSFRGPEHITRRGVVEWCLEQKIAKTAKLSGAPRPSLRSLRASVQILRSLESMVWIPVKTLAPLP